MNLISANIGPMDVGMFRRLALHQRLAFMFEPTL